MTSRTLCSRVSWWVALVSDRPPRRLRTRRRCRAGREGRSARSRARLCVAQQSVPNTTQNACWTSAQVDDEHGEREAYCPAQAVPQPDRVQLEVRAGPLLRRRAAGTARSLGLPHVQGLPTRPDRAGTPRLAQERRNLGGGGGGGSSPGRHRGPDGTPPAAMLTSRRRAQVQRWPAPPAAAARRRARRCRAGSSRRRSASARQGGALGAMGSGLCSRLTRTSMASAASITAARRTSPKA